MTSGACAKLSPCRTHSRVRGFSLSSLPHDCWSNEGCAGIRVKCMDAENPSCRCDVDLSTIPLLKSSGSLEIVDVLSIFPLFVEIAHRHSECLVFVIRAPQVLCSVSALASRSIDEDVALAAKVMPSTNTLTRLSHSPDVIRTDTRLRPRQRHAGNGPRCWITDHYRPRGSSTRTSKHIAFGPLIDVL
jgi:hypothetical protein